MWRRYPTLGPSRQKRITRHNGWKVVLETVSYTKRIFFVQEVMEVPTGITHQRVSNSLRSPNEFKAFKLRIYISLKPFFGLSIGLSVELDEKNNCSSQGLRYLVHQKHTFLCVQWL